MIAGGICHYGLTNLVFFRGTQNNFSYKQFLLFMKNDLDKFKKDNELKMIYYSSRIMLHAIPRMIQRQLLKFYSIKIVSTGLQILPIYLQLKMYGQY